MTKENKSANENLEIEDNNKFHEFTSVVNSSAFIWITAVLKTHVKCFHNPQSNLDVDFSWVSGPQEKFDISWILSSKGSENFQLYFWVLKDLSWTQDWYISGFVFGPIAVIWSGFLVLKTIYNRNWYETIISVSQLLWLFGNVWWMSGELHDKHFPNSPSWYDQRQKECGYILQCAISLLALYYCIIKPLKLFRPSDEALAHYDESGLICKYHKVVGSWRDYENVHVLFWLGKDIAWNGGYQALWVMFAVPTTLIALEFVLVTFLTKQTFIDHMHYLAQLLWVSANLVWAIGELWHLDSDEPYVVASEKPSWRRSSACILVAACCVVGLLYAVWLPLSATLHLPLPARSSHLPSPLSESDMDLEMSENPLRSTVDSAAY